MPTSFDDVEAICPYFQYSQKKFIVCEGIIDGSTTKLEFNTHYLQSIEKQYNR